MDSELIWDRPWPQFPASSPAALYATSTTSMEPGTILYISWKAKPLLLSPRPSE